VPLSVITKILYANMLSKSMPIVGVFILPNHSTGSPLYRELYISTLVKLQQFENRLLRTIVTGTTLQRRKIKFIRDTLHISTVKSFITQRHIKFYHNMHHIPSPLFSLVRAPTRTCWHQSRIIDITQEQTDHLHRWGRRRHQTNAEITRSSFITPPQDLHTHIFKYFQAS